MHEIYTEKGTLQKYSPPLPDSLTIICTCIYISLYNIGTIRNHSLDLQNKELNQKHLLGALSRFLFCATVKNNPDPAAWPIKIRIATIFDRATYTNVHLSTRYFSHWKTIFCYPAVSSTVCKFINCLISHCNGSRCATAVPCVCTYFRASNVRWRSDRCAMRPISSSSLSNHPRCSLSDSAEPHSGNT